MNRREFIYTGITGGIALAVSSPLAAAITTSDEGISTESVKIPTAKGEMPAFQAVPKGKGPFPVVIVVHEIFGVHAYIQDICRRLAKQGYYAVSPYLYFREGDVTGLKSIDEIFDRVVNKVSQAQVMGDLDATMAWLEKTKKADVKRAAITGFCWGGNTTWMYASHNPKLKAGVAWYGKVAPAPTPNQPKVPVDIAVDLKVPVLGLYGAKDKGIPLDTVEKMRVVLAKGKSQSEIVVYPEADHGFHADYRPTYHESSAKDAWEKMLQWFKKNGV